MPSGGLALILRANVIDWGGNFFILPLLQRSCKKTRPTFARLAIGSSDAYPTLKLLTIQGASGHPRETPRVPYPQDPHQPEPERWPRR